MLNQETLHKIRTKKSIDIQTIDTVALTVSNIDLSLNFYVKALGFKLVADITLDPSENSSLYTLFSSRCRIATLQLGSEFIELIQFLDLKSSPIPADSRCHDLWFQHIAIVVSDMELAYEHLKSFAFEPISNGPQTLHPQKEPDEGIQAFKFRDRDRHSLELICFPDTEKSDKWNQINGKLFLGIDHSAIAVSDTDKALRFYRNILGMKGNTSNLQAGSGQAKLDAFPSARVWITPLRATGSKIGIELLDYVSPRTGRSIPNNWSIDHLSHMHVVLEVKDIDASLELLKQQWIKIISPCPVKFPSDYRYSQGAFIRDPDDRSLLLVTS